MKTSQEWLFDFLSWLNSRNTFSFLSIQEDLFTLTPTFSRLLRKHPGSCWQLRSRECWQESWYWEPVCLHQVGFFCTWGLTGNLIPGQLVVVVWNDYFPNVNFCSMPFSLCLIQRNARMTNKSQSWACWVAGSILEMLPPDVDSSGFWL